MSEVIDRCGEEGFSLIELLVSMALLALISVVLLSTLHHSRLMSRMPERLERGAAIESVAGHLRRTIEDARVGYRAAPDGADTLGFLGTADGLKLVVVADGRLELGGLYEVEYALAPAMRDSGLRDLVTRRSLVRAASGGGRHVARTEEVALIRGVRALRLRYFGSPAVDQAPAWLAEWSRVDALPRLVEVSIEFLPGDDRRWPPLRVLLPSAL